MFILKMQIKKKNRWMFEGVDATGSVVFPDTFVRVESYPPYAYTDIHDANGGKIVPIEGAYMIKFLYPNDKEPIDHQKIDIGFLKLYDGCCNLLDFWEIDIIEVLADTLVEPMSEEDDQYQYVIRYKEFKKL